ncbi:MAG TPA: alpha/beta hydrolase [Polyangiales bacterium]|nr:alpha/beta hydrolase [Polyangiales bacterium]
MIDPNSFERWLSLRAYGWFTSAMFRPDTAPRRMRARFDRWASSSREQLRLKYPELVFEDHPVGPLAMESVCAVPAPRCVILHLHGGAFFFGSLASYRQRAMRFSYRCDAEVFVPEYRLAPEHPFPAALEDALAAIQYLRALRPGYPIFVTGDSAGGGLALSLLARLRDRGQPLPAGAIMLSPWMDLTSAPRTPRRDRWLTPAHLLYWSAHYAGTTERDNPELSPVFADLSRLPPLLLLAGEDEILLDDALRVAEAASRAGTIASVIVGKGMQHDWPLTMPRLPESKQAWRAMRAFVDAHAAQYTFSPTQLPASL